MGWSLCLSDEMSSRLWYSCSLFGVENTQFFGMLFCWKWNMSKSVNSTCLFSASFTAWLTWLRIFLQHSSALLTFSLSSSSSVCKNATKQQGDKSAPETLYQLFSSKIWLASRMLHSQNFWPRLSRRACVTCVLCHVFQKEWVFGESLDLHRNNIFKLESTAQSVPFRLLKKKETRHQNQHKWDILLHRWGY